MKIGINASFLRKQNTGIGQVTANFLKKLAEFPITPEKFQDKEEIEFVLYLEEDVELNLPGNFQKKVFLPAYTRDDIFRAIWWQKYLLPRRVKADGCDVFFSLYQSATVMPGKIKHIMLVHDILLEFFPNYVNNWRKLFFWHMTKKAIRRADKIMTVSHRTEKDLIQHLGMDAQKITAAYIDVDPLYKEPISEEKSQEILKKYGLEKGYIYSGGGLDMRKNVEGTLRAYKILFEAYGHASWLPKIVVSGKLMPALAPLVTDVKTIIQGLQIENQVSILDFVPQEDLPALYRNAGLFVYPSLYEGFGLPVLEAMAQGTPTITSKKSSLPEVGGDAVLYCDPADVDDLAMVMKNVLLNDHLKIALSLKGKERSMYFSWDKFVEKFLHIATQLKK